MGPAAAAVAMPTPVPQASVSPYHLMELVVSLISKELSVLAMDRHTHTYMPARTASLPMSITLIVNPSLFNPKAEIHYSTTYWTNG